MKKSYHGRRLDEASASHYSDVQFAAILTSLKPSVPWNECACVCGKCDCRRCQFRQLLERFASTDAAGAVPDTRKTAGDLSRLAGTVASAQRRSHAALRQLAESPELLSAIRSAEQERLVIPYAAQSFPARRAECVFS